MWSSRPRLGFSSQRRAAGPHCNRSEVPNRSGMRIAGRILRSLPYLPTPGPGSLALMLGERNCVFSPPKSARRCLQR
jgi:hypothetical protein